MKNQTCTHLDHIHNVRPSSKVCDECVKMGSTWVHLRECLECGNVACCDDSPNRHATKHYHASKHPIIRSFQPGESWKYCYIDNLMWA